MSEMNQYTVVTSDTPVSNHGAAKPPLGIWRFVRMLSIVALVLEFAILCADAFRTLHWCRTLRDSLLLSLLVYVGYLAGLLVLMSCVAGIIGDTPLQRKRYVVRFALALTFFAVSAAVVKPMADRLYQARLRKTKLVMQDLVLKTEAIKRNIGRFPADQAELVSQLGGESMMLSGWRDAITYIRVFEEGSDGFRLSYTPPGYFLIMDYRSWEDSRGVVVGGW